MKIRLIITDAAPPLSHSPSRIYTPTQTVVVRRQPAGVCKCTLNVFDCCFTCARNKKLDLQTGGRSRASLLPVLPSHRPPSAEIPSRICRISSGGWTRTRTAGSGTTMREIRSAAVQALITLDRSRWQPQGMEMLLSVES
jgi:hypothetical protein